MANYRVATVMEQMILDLLNEQQKTNALLTELLARTPEPFKAMTATFSTTAIESEPKHRRKTKEEA